jgi:4a-hydroxytetrahydrobiopterin dehydratase
MSTLDAETVRERLSRLPGWTIEGGALVRKFTFAGFPDAVAFVVRLGFAAEAADHHPDFLMSYKRVTLTYVTHSAGGLTTKDFEGAAAADEVAAVLGGTSDVGPGL